MHLKIQIIIFVHKSSLSATKIGSLGEQNTENTTKIKLLEF